nr:MAG TPA: hypothetical protein [Bacteriophage sp.]
MIGNLIMDNIFLKIIIHVLLLNDLLMMLNS